MNCFNFFSDTEMNDEKDMYLPFINFHPYGNVRRCYLHKQLLPNHLKTWTLCMNQEIVWRWNIKTQRIIVMESFNNMDFTLDNYTPKIENWIFIYHMFKFLAKITVQVNSIECFWVIKKYNWKWAISYADISGCRCTRSLSIMFLLQINLYAVNYAWSLYIM